ncbi:hypothetical protein DFH08DRAFT_936519 [Mycena albidolilacea]|uniref:Uncharacterized protein n=1 Tax=Mycena albidolilacea TaxID=1033008 RepID=A0AAD7A399_9AGAR|nr:hypothetical protein DFH08DRAFT_936519 [Mycena albidolilacea]
MAGAGRAFLSLPPPPTVNPHTSQTTPSHGSHLGTPIIRVRIREIALATPALWKAIGLRNADIPFSPQDHWLEAWLSRSGACPLSIVIDNHGSCILPETIAAAIVARRARFQQLGLNIHLSSLAKIAGPMPLLRWLDLSVIHRSNSHVVAFYDTPLLHTEMLAGGMVRGFLHSFIAPTLRKLEVEEVFLEADPIQSLKLFMSKTQCKL